MGWRRTLAKYGMENPQDTVTIDIPLLIRLLELAREDIKDDATLHQVAEKLTRLGLQGRTLNMDDYDEIASAAQPDREIRNIKNRAGIGYTPTRKD